MICLKILICSELHISHCAPSAPCVVCLNITVQESSAHGLLDTRAPILECIGSLSQWLEKISQTTEFLLFDRKKRSL